jgi:hypothetical protein
MKENVGRKDQAVRSVVGPMLMAAGYWTLGGNKGRFWGIFAIVTGALIIESAITRVCPTNALAGIDTRESLPIQERLRQMIGA